MLIHDKGQENNLLHHVIEQHNACDMRIVGNSIGEGCATLLSLMHKNQHANLRCSYYSTPGELFSYELATCYS